MIIFAILVFLNLQSSNAVSAATAPAKVYSPVSVPKANLTEATTSAIRTTEEIPGTPKELLCAIEASRRPWCYLMCLEGSQCHLYDLLVHPIIGQEDMVGTGMTDTCRSSVPAGACVTNETLYEEGETYDVEEKCETFVCENGLWKESGPVLAPTSCVAPFMDDPLAGCIYIGEEELPFCSALRYCQSKFGGRLFFPDSTFDLVSLQLYLQQEVTDFSTEFWVGGKSRKWMDGRDVAVEEWASTDPNGPLDECVRLTDNNGLYFAADRVCTHAFKPICQLIY